MSPGLSVGDAQYGAARSRRLLVDTIRALGPLGSAATVVGAHAVHLWVQDAWGPVAMEATRDADVVVNPVFIAADPKLVDLLAGIGVGPALPDRPGLYGYEAESSHPLTERTTVDVIVPEVYAGAGRRAARILGQRHAAGRALGLELAVWDRHAHTVSTLDEPTQSIGAFVAGPAALLVAKAHKVHERLAAYATRPARLRVKDSGDVALLMTVSDPTEVAETMEAQVSAHPETTGSVRAGSGYLTEPYGSHDAVPRIHAVQALAPRFDEAQVHETMDRWLGAFDQASGPNRRD
ncbi:MAG: hypothetical protein LBK72_01440 [Bifidobacteriaceae bacterium]|jgi:hypothetical protein|nr:hypothetical protein [Bifidobacteriaceae bacterium]